VLGNQPATRTRDRALPGKLTCCVVEQEGFLLADLGEVALRGFKDSVRLYEARWREGD
jgi:hypothetical protein